MKNNTRKFAVSGAMALAITVSAPARAAPWSGSISGYSAFINEVSKPVRLAIVNNLSSALPDSDYELRNLANRYNALQIDIFLDYTQPDASAKRILDALAAGSKLLPDHPEIQNLNVALIGFSAGSAGAAITASSPLLSNPDPQKAPQRVLAVVNFDELDFAPYLPPAWVPQLFLSDPGDFYGGLLTNVEDLTPPVTHEAFARKLAADGRPITIVSQPADWHGGSLYGWKHVISGRFMRFWMQDILDYSLPQAAPTTGPVMAPDWRSYSGTWRGAYDVVKGTSAQPWAALPGGDREHMANVVIAPSADYRDPRPFTWLPSQYMAGVWKTYAETGAMPPAPGKKLWTERMPHFIRPGANATGSDPTYGDSPVTTSLDSGPLAPGYTSGCGFSKSGDANLIATFDRPIASADIQAVGAVLAGPVKFWTNIVIAPLKRTVVSTSLDIQLTNIQPVDGSPSVNLHVVAKYGAGCPF